MICWKVSHKYKLIDHIERKNIGIYSSLENAEKAIASLKTKSGFMDTVDGFRISKVFTLFKPRLLDNTYWFDGFDTYQIKLIQLEKVLQGIGIPTSNHTTFSISYLAYVTFSRSFICMADFILA